MNEKSSSTLSQQQQQQHTCNPSGETKAVFKELCCVRLNETIYFLFETLFCKIRHVASDMHETRMYIKNSSSENTMPKSFLSSTSRAKKEELSKFSYRLTHFELRQKENLR